MSRYYKMIIDEFIETLSICDAGNTVNWNYDSQQNRDIISSISANDYILAIKTNGHTAYILKVITNGTVLTVEKNCEFTVLAPEIDATLEVSEITETEFKQIIHNAFEWANTNTTEETHFTNIRYETRIFPGEKRNRIYFGAPGTGKSYKVNSEKERLLQAGGTFERVTFHPDYTYANFVGTYKPVPVEGNITYQFVPGPFMRVYVDALVDARENGENAKPHILIVEEINRANVAAVFGDIFQLLDRKENISEYPIMPSEDVKAYLALKLGGDASNYNEIKIPDNMFIWASMNSADQGVFPMDTAFKRRWDFVYIGIDENEEKINAYDVEIAGQTINWNELRKAINNHLTSLGINEDKLLGPFFVNEEALTNSRRFIETFKNKVIMYLFEDAAKQKRTKVFAAHTNNLRYSQICSAFDTEGVKVFAPEIYKELIEEDDTE